LFFRIDYPRQGDQTSLYDMDLDWQVCSRARLSRDARFDGKFFVGVLTTGIYCRPICRAPTAKEKNVRYFSSAAEAAEAGLRPCLRCRPECAPGTSAWLGTRSTVSRALKLIGESGLEEGGIETLAGHLGIGSRHLRRLFLKHLGATPRAVAETRRLHFAKKLIDETVLPMNEVALAAGFGCVRRFNAGIRKVYNRTPSQIRRLARQTPAQPENEYLFRLRFRPPYNWNGMLAFLAARAIPGVETVAHGAYCRSMALNGVAGCFEVSPDAVNNALVVHLRFGEPRSLFFIIERIRAMFDLNADWAAIVETLKSDPMLLGPAEANPGLRVPGCWNGFELTVRAILGQQMTLKGAAALAGNLVRTFGQRFASANGLTHLFPSPDVLADATLTGIGLPRTRADTIRALARAVCNGQLRYEGIVDSEAFLTRLREIPGIGEWTSQYVAMRALGEPDAIPSSDLALQRALGLANSHDFAKRAEAWRPWRAYAAVYLWDFGAGMNLEAKRRTKSAPVKDSTSRHHAAAGG
jgi:AraC family transcriptional regulator, regulatory protein of adaptative response / DNA-3-methyladenine glycosylase II